MTILDILILITCAWIKISESTNEYEKLCDKNRCYGKYAIKDPPGHLDKIAIGEVDLEIDEYPEAIEIGLVKRRKLTIYCYDGSSLDPNTGCEEKVTEMLPTLSQARDWVTSKKCMTGFECPPDGECWGADAQRCLSINSNKNSRQIAGLKWKGERYMMFPYHTCVMSWECIAIKTEVSVIVSQYGSSTERMYTTSNGETVALGPRFFEDGFHSTDGYWHIPLKDRPKQKVKRAKGRCYSSDPSHIECMVTRESKYDGMSIDILRFPHGRIRSDYITIKGKILTVSNNAIITLGEGYLDDRSYQLVEAQRAASVESIKEALSSLSITQLQSIHNVVENENRIHRIERIIREIIKALSHLNPNLLSSIMGREVFQTHWISPSYFQICPCFQQKQRDESNSCFDESVYTDGAFLPKSNPLHCTTTEHLNKTLIDIYKEGNLDVVSLQNIPPSTASTDSSAWDAIQRIRTKLIYDDLNQHESGQGGSSSNYNYSQDILGVVRYWFVTLSSLVGWVALVLALCLIKLKS